MTANERKLESIEKEIAKLTKSLERCETLLAKKVEQCKKLGCLWTREEYRTIMDKFYARHAGEGIVRLGNDDDIITAKQNGAYFDMSVRQGEVEDLKTRLENANRRHEKASAVVKEENEKNEKFQAEYARLSEMELNFLKQKREQEYKEWLEQFVKACAEDGIAIDTKLIKPSNNIVCGTTPKGKRFCWELNNGTTERSWHCYSLRIDGETIFTSGEWWRCYNVVKNH